MRNTAYIFFLIVIFSSFAEAGLAQTLDPQGTYFTLNNRNIKAALNTNIGSGSETLANPMLDKLSSEQVLRSLESLSVDFLNFSANEHEKVKEIFLWVAKNIDYDVSAARNPSPTAISNNPMSVFHYRRGLCLGFAELFASICRQTGIEARVITGYAKGAAYKNDIFSAPNHAWNSVKINDKWHLVDVAWASSLRASIEEQFDKLPDNQFTDRYLLEYFVVSPAEFLKTHLPEDPFWQLTGEPINLTTFEAGESAITSSLHAAPGSHINFEYLIAGHEALDSLDQTICYYERITENQRNKDREFALGLAYFYKAQAVLNELPGLEAAEKHLEAKRAKVYYGKALDYLDVVDPSSPYFDNGTLICDNIRLKMGTLGNNVYF